jgi:hypothetical protein
MKTIRAILVVLLCSTTVLVFGKVVAIHLETEACYDAQKIELTFADAYGENVETDGISWDDRKLSVDQKIKMVIKGGTSTSGERKGEIFKVNMTEAWLKRCRKYLIDDHGDLVVDWSMKPAFDFLEQQEEF